MANICTNWVQFDNPSIKGIAKIILRKEAASPDGFKVQNDDDQWIFDTNFNEDPPDTPSSFSFETRWGTHDSTVISLVKVLECSWLILEYQESGMALAGVYEYDGTHLIHRDVTSEYWKDEHERYENDSCDEPADITDYLNEQTKRIIKL